MRLQCKDQLNLSTHSITIVFILVINKRATNRVVRSAINIPTIRTFAVSLLIQLERCIRTQIFDVLCKKFNYK